MADFEINPQSVSWREIVKQLKAFLLSKPDDTAWKDFYDCGAGTTMIELLAGYATFSKRDLIVNRRETYLYYAKNISSVIGIASNYGYSAYRGLNQHIRLKIIPNTTIGISKFQIVGSVKNIDLVSLDNYSLIAGQPITIDLVIGNLKQSIVTSNSDLLQVFRFLESNVSEDFRIIVNNIEVPVTNQPIEMLNDKYLTLTNSFGGLDTFYLNQGDYNYITLTDIILDYIELYNLNYDFPTDIKFLYGDIQPLIVNPTITDTQILSLYIPPETIDSIKINAPLRFETQKTIRGREDFKKTFKLLNPLFLDTNARDLSPARVELTYLKSDLTFLSTIEKNNYINQLQDFTNYGVIYENMSDPVEVKYSLAISIKQHPNIDLSNINNSIMEIFAYVHERNNEINEDTRIIPREKKFQTKFDLEYIEHELNQLPQVKISRVALNTKTYTLNTVYKRGDFVKLLPDNGFIYECVRGGLSGLINPSFTTNINELTLESIENWQSVTTYNLNDIIVPSPFNGRAYKCVQAGTTAVGQPLWLVELNSLINDGTCQWECIDILSVNTIIWKCLSPDVRELDTEWNEYIILDYGTGIIWL